MKTSNYDHLHRYRNLFSHNTEARKTRFQIQSNNIDVVVLLLLLGLHHPLSDRRNS